MGALEIINALAASRRAVTLYPPEHPAHREAVDDLVAAVKGSVDVRPLVLNVRNGRLHEGSEVIASATPTIRSLAETLESRRVESLTFHLGFGDHDATGLSEVLSLRPTPDLQVMAELQAREVRAVTVSELEDLTSAEAEDRDRRREADRALYRQALTALTEITTSLAEETPVDPHVVTRTIAAFVERSAESPHGMLALASMTGHGDPQRFHAMSVMLHALVMGGRLGLSDNEILSLGLAGLLHDVGKALLRQDDPASYTSHPLVGAQALGAVADDECAAMLVALEHHMGVDGSGFPGRQADYPIHPYSKLIAVIDRYDGLLRPAQGEPMRPDMATAQLMEEGSGGALDPILTRLFVETVGIIPVSAVVRLSDFSIGIVCRPGEDPLRPEIRLIIGSDGHELRPTIDVLMTEDDRVIVEVVPENAMGIRPSDYL